MQDYNPYGPPRSTVDDQAPASAGPVAVFPFVLACLAMFLACLAVSAGLRFAYGLHFPALNGLIAAITSVGIAAWLFGRRHRRQFLSAERIRFTLGCFVVFWFFDGFLKIAVRVANGIETTTRRLAVDIAATIVDFLIIWVVVLLLAPVLIRLSVPSSPSPNKSLERTRDR